MDNTQVTLTPVQQRTVVALLNDKRALVAAFNQEMTLLGAAQAALAQAYAPEPGEWRFEATAEGALALVRVVAAEPPAAGAPVEIDGPAKEQA